MEYNPPDTYEKEHSLRIEGIVDSLELNFQKDNGLKGFVPVIVQSNESGNVLMMGYTDESLLFHTLYDRRVYLWDRRNDNRFYLNNEGANEHFEGHLDLYRIRLNCNKNALVYTVNDDSAYFCFENSCFREIKI